MRNVLLVHDISCYGKCSSTVALPLLSMMGVSGTLLPTSLLSTHTGSGFEGFTFLDLSGEMKKIVAHWKRLGLQFDAAYVGYLGSSDQIDFLIQELPSLLKPGAKFYLDPVMADNGEFYTGFDAAYAQKMKSLAQLADVLLPNQTELSLLFDLPYQEGVAGLEDIQSAVDTLSHQSKSTALIVTGAGYDGQGQIGAYVSDPSTHTEKLLQAPFIAGRFHGTGDIFASLVVGAMENGASLEESTKFAVDSLSQVVQTSIQKSKVNQEGMAFEAFGEKFATFARSCREKRVEG